MLTVLIYRKSSKGFLDQYRPLFKPYLDSGKIAFCFWDEDGMDVDNAVHDLQDTVRGVREWQAVVVLPLDKRGDEVFRQKEDREEFPTREDNPFDYLCNSDPEPKVHESKVPLIRLAQMLGGIPLVNQHFESEFERHGDSAASMRMVRQETQESLLHEQEKWNELNDKYSVTFDYPKRLFLFAAVEDKKITIPKEKDVDVMRRHDSDSSLFWYRNRYPAITRFLVQKCARPANAHYHEDLFRFWMTALTLAINEFPSGTFEAYKVYNVIGRLNTGELHDLMSDYYNRLGNILYSVNAQITQIRKELGHTPETGSNELPFYETQIPVTLELRDDDDLEISTWRIGLAGDCPIQEEPWWYRKVKDSINAVDKLYSSTRRVLDRACLQCRYSARVTDEEIIDLDEYQFEDMKQELNTLEQEILTFNTYTALPIHAVHRQLDQAKRAAGTSMRKRMTRRITVISGLIALGVYIMGFIPDLVYQLVTGGEFLSVLWIVLAGSGLAALISMGCLFHFRGVIRNKIRDYNAVIEQFLALFSEAGAKFSHYLGKCASYMRGRYILKALERKTILSSEEIVRLSNHSVKLEVQMKKIADWLSDFGLKPKKSVREYNNEYFDYMIPPENNRSYEFQLDQFVLAIPLESGGTCTAPYPFIDEFIARRVPLFEVEPELYAESDETETVD